MNKLYKGMPCVTNIMKTSSYLSNYPEASEFFYPDKKFIGVIRVGAGRQYQLIGFNKISDSEWELGPVENKIIDLFGQKPRKGKTVCGIDYGD